MVRGDAKYLEKFMGYLPLNRGLVRELARRLRSWCATEVGVGGAKSQASHRRQQLLQHLRLLLRNCEDQPLVAEMCREFGLQPASL